MGTAEITLKHIPEYEDTISFHCQQAVEKYLKGYLIYLDIEFRKTHDLKYLLDLIRQKEKFPDIYYEKADDLQHFAIEIKYPNAKYDPDDLDVKKSIENAKTFRKFFLKKMNLGGFEE